MFMTLYIAITAQMSQYLFLMAYGRQIVSESNITLTPTGTLTYRIIKWLRISIPEPNHLALRSVRSGTPGRKCRLIRFRSRVILRR